MKQTQGKFILFDIAEFGNWLNTTPIYRVIKLIQNHHTWSPSYKHFKTNNHFSLLKGMENAHLERGFNQIAQNLTTFPDGSIAVCRPLNITPAGIKGANTNGICIENIGNFDSNNDQMTNEHKDTIIKVNALLCKKFNLTPSTDTIVYHHWYDLTKGIRTNGTGSTKTCPGTAFFGGNKVSDAENNFIPLINQDLNDLDHIQPIAIANILFTARVDSDTPLNIRVTPSASSKKVGELNNGSIVHVYEQNGVWGKIDPTEPHWVNGKFLEKIS